jgi:hypothetical protein
MAAENTSMITKSKDVYECDGKHLWQFYYEKKKINGTLHLDDVHAALHGKGKCIKCNSAITGSIFCRRPEGPYCCSLECAAKPSKEEELKYLMASALQIWEYGNDGLWLTRRTKEAAVAAPHNEKLEAITHGGGNCVVCGSAITWSTFFSDLSGPYYCCVGCAMTN